MEWNGRRLLLLPLSPFLVFMLDTCCYGAFALCILTHMVFIGLFAYCHSTMVRFYDVAAFQAVVAIVRRETLGGVRPALSREHVHVTGPNRPMPESHFI